MEKHQMEKHQIPNSKFQVNYFSNCRENDVIPAPTYAKASAG